MAVITNYNSAGGNLAGLHTSNLSIRMPRSALGLKRSKRRTVRLQEPTAVTASHPSIASRNLIRPVGSWLRTACEGDHDYIYKLPVRAIKMPVMRSSRRSCREEMKGAWNQIVELLNHITAVLDLKYGRAVPVFVTVYT